VAKDERKRQKSLAKKKQRENRIRKQANINRNPSAADTVQAMLRGSWYKCIDMEAAGISNLLCIRSTPNGFSACAFLVDSYCLGVKDVTILRDIDIQAAMERSKAGDCSVITPEYALKKIQTAIDEARKIGFEPHPKTALGLKIFEGVDANACEVDFEFGLDGKPMFVPGPFDDNAKIVRVMRKLQELGEGNYHYLVHGGNPTMFSPFEAAGSLDDDDELGEDEYEEDDMVLEAEKVTYKSN
jgi:hypothetical protein